MGLSHRTEARAQSYALADGVRRLSLAGRNLVHVESRQQLLELNDTAATIWRALEARRSVVAAADEIAGPGLSVRRTRQIVRQAAAEWTAAGYLIPNALDESLSSGDGADRTLVLDELVVDLHVDSIGVEELDPVFGHLFAIKDGARRRLTIIEHGGRLLFYLERNLVLASGPEGLAAGVKALLTDLYLDVVDNGFLAHGALLLRGEQAVMLCGEPGAGKTTLALALAAAGWRYGGDDIVRFAPDGMVRGVPFAAAVKRGSLPLLRPMWPDLEVLREWARPDGLRARYLTPPNLAPAAPCVLSAVVVLARGDGAAPRLRPISVVDALGEILSGAYAERWRMTGEALCALAASLDRAVCVKLEYSDLEAAVGAIGGIAGVQAKVA